MPMMAYLIDGNNLLFALGDVGRGKLRRMLEPLARTGQKVHLVFDGPAPEEETPEASEAPSVRVTYAGPQSADEVIEAVIAGHGSPRALTVVSSDREVRRAARRRRCRVLKSQTFARELSRLRRRPKGPPPEPPEKRRGLEPGQRDAWLREFGLDDEGEAPRGDDTSAR